MRVRSAALGTKVHLIDSRDVLLPFLDSEVSAALTRAMGRNGIEMHCGERVAECNSAGREITLTLQSGSHCAHRGGPCCGGTAQ